MRKLLVLILATAVAAVAFADDALVLPKGVMRARVTGAYSWASEEFDDDADKVDLFGGLADKLTVFNVGAAIEYGIIEGVNIAAQWVPGYNVSSEFDSTAFENAKVNGAYDLFVGAKAQIIGDQGLVSKNEIMRFAAAAGFVVPLPGADFEDQADNAIAGDDYIIQDPDRHVFGAGFRLYFDYVVNKMFFVNLYAEFIKFFKRDLEVLAFTPLPTAVELEFDYGYQLTLEVEPHFEMPLAEGMQLKTGLPITYVTTPESEVEGTGQDDESYSLTVRPYAALFVTKTPLPLEFELGYMYPIAGKNTLANSALTLQVKAFAKF